MSDLAPTVQQEVARLAASPDVRSAFNWFRTQEPQLSHWQMKMARIAAPPFGESARGAWLAERFREVGLDDVRIDDVGNVFGTHPGFGRRCVCHERPAAVVQRHRDAQDAPASLLFQRIS